MKIKLLLDQLDHEQFVEEQALYPQDAPVPDRFPCYVYLETISFQCEDEEARYLYENDVADMLKLLTSHSSGHEGA